MLLRAEARIDPAAVPQLRAVAAVLAGLDNPLHVKGQTDNLPIVTAQFPSNWHPAAVRAAAAGRLFIDTGGAPARVAVLGYGDACPVVFNATAEGPARNGRVNLRVMACEGASAAATSGDSLP